MDHIDVGTRDFLDRAEHYLGKAKIRIDCLEFEGNTSRARTINTRHISHLANVFKSGCYWLRPENYVPALVNRAVLARSLELSSLRQRDLLRDGEPCELILPDGATLTALHGQHRLLAAKEVLWPTDQWWLVELYSSGKPSYSASRKIDTKRKMSLKPGLPSSTKAAICEADSHELRFCHGDIYRQLRYHEMNGEIEEAARWKCRFSKSIRDNIDNFQRKHGRMAREFDRLLPFVGLWPGIELGAFHRWLHSKCDEAYVHYLQRMFDSWSSIFGDQEELFPLLDHNTVFHLETLAPRHATRDAGKIRELMQGGRIFSMVRHDEDRRVILEQLLATDGRILSFKTFLQDTLYLEPCAKALRRLLPSKPPGSLREAFFGSYTGVNQVPGEIRVQTRESGMVVYHGTQATSRMLGYAQIQLDVALPVSSFSKNSATSITTWNEDAGFGTTIDEASSVIPADILVDLGKLANTPQICDPTDNRVSQKTDAMLTLRDHILIRKLRLHGQLCGVRFWKEAMQGEMGHSARYQLW
ncbi:uncharacterized protein CIMG_08260 [Coccidioides immitis RS]|uniref:Uncharacterized protein n=1 Tax=Coccidioides immitis (strain RS) TaxID=246410 RepID=J3K551_COCIM|nr:uncharacterized protein CIMG_08260 [Coccidioides immitis RS]EAS29514.3 hypothetical protein CIMG_08260 [Coccidioides immitis RS]